MYKFSAFTLFFFISIQLQGQSIDPEVIAAAGESFIVPNGPSLSWTMGECAVEAHSIGNAWLTLGFHQMYAQPMSVPTKETSALAGLIRLSPNPTSGILGIQNLSGFTLSAAVTDATGRLLVETENIDYQHEFDFSNFPAGNYFLQFFSKNELVTTFKIVKQ